MNDIELTEEHDIQIFNGDFSLLGSTAKVAKQALKINLLMYQGEWFLDTNIGIPYFQEIFKKMNNTTLVDNIIQEAVLASYNIRKITTFSSSLSPNRTYSVDLLGVMTTDGEIISINTLQAQ